VRFDYRVCADGFAVVCLLAALASPRALSLLLRRATARLNYPALAAKTSPGWRAPQGSPVSRCAPTVIECPQALFDAVRCLGARGRTAINRPALDIAARSLVSVHGQRRPLRSL